ncbi:hypothetical protein GCM10028808_58180 [Spirosoma migulaei]
MGLGVNPVRLRYKVTLFLNSYFVGIYPDTKLYWHDFRNKAIPEEYFYETPIIKSKYWTYPFVQCTAGSIA